MFVVNTRARDSFITVDGSEIRLLVDRTNSAITTMSLAEATVPVGGATIRHHLREMDEIFYILRGKGRMHIGDEARELGPGDAVWIPAGKIQWIENVAPEPLVFLCAVAPAYTPEQDIPE